MGFSHPSQKFQQPVGPTFFFFLFRFFFSPPLLSLLLSARRRFHLRRPLAREPGRPPLSPLAARAAASTLTALPRASLAALPSPLWSRAPPPPLCLLPSARSWRKLRGERGRALAATVPVCRRGAAGAGFDRSPMTLRRQLGPHPPFGGELRSLGIGADMPRSAHCGSAPASPRHGSTRPVLRCRCRTRGRHARRPRMRGHQRRRFGAPRHGGG